MNKDSWSGEVTVGRGRSTEEGPRRLDVGRGLILLWGNNSVEPLRTIETSVRVRVLRGDVPTLIRPWRTLRDVGKPVDLGEGDGCRSKG